MKVKIVRCPHPEVMALLIEEHLNEGYEVMSPLTDGLTIMLSHKSNPNDGLPFEIPWGHYLFQGYPHKYTNVHQFICDHCQSKYYFSRNQCKQCGSDKIIQNPDWKWVDEYSKQRCIGS